MPVSRQAATRFIVALGTISLFSDVTYEGARSVNGPFLATLGAGAAVVGIVSGAGELIGYLLRLFSGRAADKTQAYWPFVISGTIINLIAVPLMALAHHWILASTLIVLERAGKGIRTPARDVMLSQASHVVGRGWGFGLHEFMDQTGAFLGPLLVALVLHLQHQYALAYAALAVPAGLAIATLFTAIRFYPDPKHFEEPTAVTPGSQTGGFPRAFWVYVAAAGLLAAGFVDFLLFAFHFQTKSIVPPGQIPVFYAIAMGVEALTALIFGKLYDRIGTPALAGGVLLSAASSPLAFFGSYYVALGGIVLWAAGMGAQQSTLRARVASLVPQEKRGSAYGIFNAVYGILWFLGSSAIGILYSRSLAVAVGLAMVAQLAAIPLLAIGRRLH